MKKLLLVLVALVLSGVEAEAKPPRSVRVAQAQTPLSIVTDAATWKTLIERAVSRPTRVQSTRVGDTTYKIYIVSTKTAVSGQDCPAGTKPENSLFVSKPVEGNGRHLYPVRVSVICRGEAGVRDSFSLDADWDGKILDASLYNGSLGLIVHPVAEPSGTAPAEPTSLDLFLARLVRQFLDAP